MDTDVIQKKCTEFLHSLGVPGFVVFGWEKPGSKEFSFVYSHHNMPPAIVIKGMGFILQDFVSKQL